METEYPEIKALQDFYTTQKVQLLNLDTLPIEDSFLVSVTIQDKSIQILIQDEFDDFYIQNRLLHVVLALNELVIIEESTDYLDWCNQQGYSANNEFLRSYYQTMIKELPTLSSYFPKGKLTAFISDWDFQLNAGAAQFLRNTRY